MTHKVWCVIKPQLSQSKMSTHNICFYGEIRKKIILHVDMYILLNKSSVLYVYFIENLPDRKGFFLYILVETNWLRCPAVLVN